MLQIQSQCLGTYCGDVQNIMSMEKLILCTYYTTLNSAYNEVTFNEKLAIMKENLCTKYFPFTYNDITLTEKLPITKENLCIFFFIIGRVESTLVSHR